MVRAELGQHVAASGEVHLQRTWKRVDEQGRTIAELQLTNAGLEEKVAELKAASTAKAKVQARRSRSSAMSTPGCRSALKR
mmetsp:Transcript_20915/g.48420  ORF Transcript_20915/g.48420 Transcript_20915/m.48420 type:complete len:81 (-) Transcript_20915:422-664(-)